MNSERRKFESEFIFKSSRSGGKGGQNVNKVETKIELNFDVENSKILNEDEKIIILEKLKNRIDKKSIFKIVSQTGRSQYINKVKAVNKFYTLLEKALVPEKPREKTKTPVIEKEKRILQKKIISGKKELRKIKLDKLLD